ncbi:MAG: hypothetical protein SOZ12_03090, partial [Anaerotignum sp.]
MRKRRILAWLMAMVMAIGLMPATALANPDEGTDLTYAAADVYQLDGGESQSKQDAPKYIWEKDDTVYVAFVTQQTKEFSKVRIGDQTLTEFDSENCAKGDSVTVGTKALTGKSSSECWQVVSFEGNLKNLVKDGEINIAWSTETGNGGHGSNGVDFTVKGWPTTPDPEETVLNFEVDKELEKVNGTKADVEEDDGNLYVEKDDDDEDDKDDKDDKLSDTYTSLIAQKIIDQDGKLTDTAKTNLTQTITTLTQLGVIDSEGNLDQTKLAELMALPQQLKALGLVTSDGTVNAEAVTQLTALQAQLASIEAMNSDGTVNKDKINSLVAQLKAAKILDDHNQPKKEEIENYKSLIKALIQADPDLITSNGLNTNAISNYLNTALRLMKNGWITADGTLNTSSQEAIAGLYQAGLISINSDGTVVPTDTGKKIAGLTQLAASAGLIKKGDNGSYTEDTEALQSKAELVSLAQAMQIIKPDDTGKYSVDDTRVQSLMGLQDQLKTAGLTKEDGTLDTDKIDKLSSMSSLVKKLSAAGITDEQGNVNEAKLAAFVAFCAEEPDDTNTAAADSVTAQENADTQTSAAEEKQETAVTEEKQEASDTSADQSTAEAQPAAEDSKADAAVTEEAAPAETDTDAAVNAETDSDETAQTGESSEADQKIAELEAQLAQKDEEIKSKDDQIAQLNDQLNAANKAVEAANVAVTQANQERDAANQAKADAEGKLAIAQQALTAATADKTGDSGSDHTAADNSAVTQSADMSNVTPAQIAAVLASSSSDTGDFSLTEEQIKAILTEYTKTVAEAAGQAGAKQAIDTIRSNADYKKLIDGARQLSDGASELNSGVNTLQTGALQLDDGAQELLDGMTKFKEEGIDKLADLFGDNLTDVIDRLKEVCDAGAEYSSFAGNDDNGTNTVKFIFKTDA